MVSCYISLPNVPRNPLDPYASHSHFGGGREEGKGVGE